MIDWIDSPAMWWLAGAVLLAVTELLVPGVFLVFLALAAAITGAITLFFPELGLGGQLIGFAAWSAVTVAIGRRWYRDYPIETSDPLLNDRVARLIGETVTVSTAIEQGTGRVHVGDGDWPARGPDTPMGARVRIVGADAGALIVEPLAELPSPAA